jgi:1-phosphofructokinase
MTARYINNERNKIMSERFKIITVTLNPCYDRQIEIPSFTHGGMNRVSSTRTDAAGKGINVSAALSNLGVGSVCTGFNYIDNGALLTDFLDERNITHDFINVPGEVRINIKLFERDTSVMTEVNQPGAFVPYENIEALFDKASLLTESADDIVVLSGSRPQNVGEDIYLRLIERFNCRCIVDTEGAALLATLNAKRKPFLIKPNLFELETAFGVKLPDKDTAINFCRAHIISTGVEYVCVSMGGDGAMLISADGAWFAPALDIPVRGLAGAGDSMVAGLVYGLRSGAAPDEILRFGAAAASASVIREGTQLCTREGFDEMLGLINIHKC